MSNMNTAAKVGEIFNATHKAFRGIGDLTIRLLGNADSSVGEKWGEDEIYMLSQAIARFSADLQMISDRVNKTQSSPLKSLDLEDVDYISLDSDLPTPPLIGKAVEVVLNEPELGVNPLHLDVGNSVFSMGSGLGDELKFESTDEDDDMNN